jgi:hypothetical protein
MNILIIILGIVVVLLSYYIYRLLTAPPSYISNTYLGQASIPTIPPSTITNPTSSNYTIGFWIFINTFSPAIATASTNGNFLAYGSDLSGSGPTTGSTAATVCSFSMDPNQPTMYTNILYTSSSGTAAVQKITITDNFPIQTWTYVLVSVNQYYADCYMNGKLVVSSQLDGPSATIDKSIAIDANKVNTLTLAMFGNTGVDVYITGLFWTSSPVDPQTAWNYYNQGNGNATSSGVTNTYHLEVDLSKDATVYKWKIF